MTPQMAEWESNEQPGKHQSEAAVYPPAERKSRRKAVDVKGKSAGKGARGKEITFSTNLSLI